MTVCSGGFLTRLDRASTETPHRRGVAPSPKRFLTRLDRASTETIGQNKEGGGMYRFLTRLDRASTETGLATVAAHLVRGIPHTTRQSEY